MTYEEYAEYRASKGMKDSDVAKAANIPQSTFSDWKKGKSKPKEEKMKKIAEALGMYYFELVNNDGQPVESDKYSDMFMDKEANKPKYDEQTQEFIHLFQNVSDADRDTVMKILRNLQQDS